MKWLYSVVIGMLTLGACGCGVSGPSTNGPETLSAASRTFDVTNAGGRTFTLVSSAVGINDGDSTTSNLELSEAGSVARLVESPSAASVSAPTDGRPYHLVLNRDKANNRSLSRATEKTVVDYDASPTLPFYISYTGLTVTLFNRTPGVGSNPGTRPTSIVTYVEQVNGVDVISTADLQRAITAWDASNPFGAASNHGIYATMHQLFGTEWTNGGGNDGDPRVVCCFLSTATIGNPGLYGYVDLNDELSPRGPTSNGGEIIYLHAQPSSISDFFQGDGFDGYATMAHELEHLIIFNTKLAQQGTFPPGASQDGPTVDEGMATLAEDLTGFSLTAKGGGNSFITYAISSYEQVATSTDGFFTFNSNGQDYGKGYLFFKYIADTLGLSTIKAIESDTETGSANIAKHVGTSFADQLQSWSIANYVSNFDSTAGYRYPDVNMAGTYTIHVHNDPSQARSQTLPGLKPSGGLSDSGVFDSPLEAFASSFLTAFAGLSSGTISVEQPSNVQTSLVQMQGGVVVSVSY